MNALAPLLDLCLHTNILSREYTLVFRSVGKSRVRPEGSALGV